MKTYVARQPIFDTSNEVIGYGLLFRQTSDNKAKIVNDYDATIKVINDLIVNFGVQELTNDKRVFIKFNNQLIYDRVPDLFPPEKLVIELSGVDFSEEQLTEYLMEYKEKGYLIALDRYNDTMKDSNVFSLVDIVMLDFMVLKDEELKRLSSSFSKMKKIIMAQKVEDDESFGKAAQLGCTFFQGYYFQKPKMFESKAAASLPTVHIQLLSELTKEDIDYQALADIIKQDSALTLSVLKLMNSVVYHTSTKVTSVKQALIRMGVGESQKVILINLLNTVLSEESSSELILVSLRRGKIAEKLAPYFGLVKRSDELFILGLLSLINVLMGRQMRDILMGVPLEEDVINALLGEENVLSKVLEVIIYNEMEAYGEVEKILDYNNCSVSTFNDIYMESVVWADRIMNLDDEE